MRFEDRPSLDGAAEELRAPRPGQSASVRAATLFKQTAEICGVLSEGSFAVLQWTRAWFANLTRARRDVERAPRFNTVLLIGAYGGDHIGDAAILGGVVLRINRRYGTTKAIRMSQRPAHTRHLVPMLETPVRIDVEAYEHAKIRECLPKVDAVVFAGGPLIDQPQAACAASLHCVSGAPPRATVHHGRHRPGTISALALGVDGTPHRAPGGADCGADLGGFRDPHHARHPA